MRHHALPGAARNSRNRRPSGPAPSPRPAQAQLPLSARSASRRSHPPPPPPAEPPAPASASASASASSGGARRPQGCGRGQRARGRAPREHVTPVNWQPGTPRLLSFRSARKSSFSRGLECVQEDEQGRKPGRWLGLSWSRSTPKGKPTAHPVTCPSACSQARPFVCKTLSPRRAFRGQLGNFK